MVSMTRGNVFLESDNPVASDAGKHSGSASDSGAASVRCAAGAAAAAAS